MHTNDTIDAADRKAVTVSTCYPDWSKSIQTAIPEIEGWAIRALVRQFHAEGRCKKFECSGK